MNICYDNTMRLDLKSRLKIISLLGLLLVSILLMVGGYMVLQDNSKNESAPTSSIHANIGESFTLGVGQSAQVSDLTLTLLEIVEDGRCPKNVDCVWSGWVVVKIEVSRLFYDVQTTKEFSIGNMGGSGQTLSFEKYEISSGTQNVYKKQPTQYGDYLISMTKTEPKQGEEGTQIPQKDYKISFKIEH